VAVTREKKNARRSLVRKSENGDVLQDLGVSGGN
jgi:uncharacterized protein YjiS (DUF1127 family)